MSISSFRSLLYGTAKGLGWLQAAQKSAKTGSVQPLVKRVERVAYGKIVGRGFRFFR